MSPTRPSRPARTPRTTARPHSSSRRATTGAEPGPTTQSVPAQPTTTAGPVQPVPPAPPPVSLPAAAPLPSAPDLRLPRRWVETVLPAELPQIARAISQRVREDISEYRWSTDSEQVRTIREGTEKALLSFVTQIFRTGELASDTEEFFRGLGRIEAIAGRRLESLLAAFRIGALIAWRRLSAAAERDPLPGDVVARLAEMVFGFSDRLAQLASEGFAHASAEEADGYERLRSRLVRMIVGQPALSPESVLELAVRAAWPLPDHVVVVEIDGRPDADALTALGPHALVDAEQPNTLVVLPAPVDAAAVSAALTGAPGRAVVGCTVALADATQSLRWSRLARRLCDDGVLPDSGVVVCDEHAPTLLLHAEPGIAEVLVARRLGPFLDMPLPRRLKFAGLLATWLELGGSQAELAQTVNAHRQTVHYRVGRLHAMFGPQLSDRDARVELLLALRWALPQWEAAAATPS